MDEYLDIVDENNRPTGQTKLKSEAHRDGDWHRASHIWIYNDQHELLFQLRAPDKDLFPNLWDITGGHVSAGESYESAAVRELEEELGIYTAIDELKPLGTQKNKEIGNEYQKMFLLQYNQPVDTLRLQEEEVSDVRFIPFSDLRTWLNDPVERRLFCPVYDYYLSILDLIELRIKSI